MIAGEYWILIRSKVTVFFLLDHDIDCLEEGNPDNVIHLLKSRNNLHLEDDNTPLHVAAYYGKLAIINLQPISLNASMLLPKIRVWT